MLRPCVRRLFVASSIALHLLLWIAPRASAAAAPPLTRARVAELARAAPAARVAAAEAGVARAATSAAGVLSLENPVLTGMGGVRLNPDGSKPAAASAALEWPIALGGQRGERIAAAQAEQRAAEAGAEDSRRRVLLAALLQHALVLRDERQVALARARVALAARLHAAAERQRKAGEVPEVDVILALLQKGRDAAAAEAAAGARDADKAALFALLGLPAQGAQDLAVEGPLVPPDEPPPLAASLGDVARRPDVGAAEASVDAARARLSRERAAGWPTVSVIAQVERDDGANIGMLGLAVPLPILNANDAGTATAAAEVEVARARADAARAGAAGELHQLHARYVATKEALKALAPTATLMQQAAAISARGYELGEKDLASVLLVRREVIEAEAALLEAEHAHAVAKIELLVAAGRVFR
ncbi:metal ion efflux outer membrane protein [Sorangium cellulosum]|uniref:Metal ion efflux outer membrane protein n=1 Tax=Sorangium cellulosum TaxID=56 RepID=A0A2L0EXY9_SORCE|nr:TolC family protein [Sorangium cellulosum]AUX44177.1 metal ion efflux outer membrane protein [Sorangium cellulosum]